MTPEKFVTYTKIFLCNCQIFSGVTPGWATSPKLNFLRNIEAFHFITKPDTLPVAHQQLQSTKSNKAQTLCK